MSDLDVEKLPAELERLARWMAVAGRGSRDAVPSWISDEAWRWVQSNREEFGRLIDAVRESGL